MLGYDYNNLLMLEGGGTACHITLHTFNFFLLMFSGIKLQWSTVHLHWRSIKLAGDEQQLSLILVSILIYLEVTDVKKE